MKITMIGTLPPIKGVSDYCIEQVEAYSKKIKVDFINFKSIYPRFLYPQDPEEQDRVFQVPKHANLSVRDCLTWYNPLGNFIIGSRIKTPVVHFHWWTSFLVVVFFPLLLAVKLLHHSKIICTAHNVVGHESGLMDRMLTRLMFILPDYYIVHTEASKRKLLDIRKIPEEQIQIIPHGRYDFYKHETISKDEARSILQVPSKSKMILFFGFIREYKGIDTLISAMKQVYQKLPEAILYIAGNSWIPWEPYKNMISEYGLDDYVFTDIRYIPSSEIQNYFVAADVVVLPYKEFDSQSGPGNISIGFHKPMVVSEVGGLPDLVLDKNVIFEPGDVNGLAEILIRILKDNKQLKKLTSDSKTIFESLGWERITERTIEFYESIESK